MKIPKTHKNIEDIILNLKEAIITMNKMEGTSLDLEKPNIEKIKELFTECVTKVKGRF